MQFDRRLFSSSLLAWAAGGAACAAYAQTARRDLYNCEGCEAVTEVRADGLASTGYLSTLDEGERLRLEGVVHLPDGVTPAPSVVIYAHHTNADGLYAHGARDTEWSRRHGRLRGWVRTDTAGRYAFETIKPAPYPSQTMPAHIHLFVGEPRRRPYYIDDVVFSGEFGVDATYRAKAENRGSSGIVTLQRRPDGCLLARRDIRLEVHPA